MWHARGNREKNVTFSSGEFVISHHEWAFTMSN